MCLSCVLYLRHISNVDHLLGGRHVAHDAYIQRVDNLTVRLHQAVLKHGIFTDIK